MSRYDDFMDDPAFQRAVRAAESGMHLAREGERQGPYPDPLAPARLVAMSVLAAFANADGLTEPHVGILARFAPDLGYEGSNQTAG